MCKGSTDLIPELATDDRALLCRALEYVLRVPEMLAHLKGVEAAITMPLVLEPETVPYHELFCAVMKDDPHMVPEKPQTAEEFFSESLVLIYRGLFTILNSFSEHVVDLVHVYTGRVRQFVRPQWSPELQRLFREKLEQFMLASLTSGQGEVFRRRFGIGGGTPQNFSEIGHDRDIRPQRAREIYQAGLRKVQRYCAELEKEWFAPFLMEGGEVLETTVQLIEVRRSDEAAFRAQLAGLANLGEQGFTASQVAFLAKRPAATEGVPVRLRNFLGWAGSWREVVRKIDDELLAMTFFGPKLLDQLKEFLQREGLHVGMSV